MPEQQDQHIKIPDSWDGKSPITIINREAKAADEIVLSKVKAETNIYGPGEYMRKHYKKCIPDADGNVEFTPSNQGKEILSYVKDFGGRRFSITFDEAPHHPIDGAKITGTLTMNPELLGWRLNEGDFMTPKSAIAFIRARVHHFGTTKEAADMINLFRNFEVKFETARKKADDTRGNVEDALTDTIKFTTGEIPKNIAIQLPVFNGCPNRVFQLEIELTRKGNEAALAFYCLEFESVLRNDADAIIDREIKPFKDLFVTLEKQ